MRYRVDDAITAAQKSTIKDSPPQKNPLPLQENRRLSEAEGYRPGVDDSHHQLNPAMQSRDGWRPSGSWSTSVHNEGRDPWTRRMVMNEQTECIPDAHYYRSGRPKMSIAFVQGAAAGYDER
ncbi:hypothetical protein ACGFYQ_27420 [Streptomyces sp. NPDC048258]|uniref:hypothetical protein n=1 Tax=Streptomyces sp. NPDC048258 TaxID=3365527 RepID=UPI00371EDF6D